MSLYIDKESEFFIKLSNYVGDINVEIKEFCISANGSEGGGRLDVRIAILNTEVVGNTIHQGIAAKLDYKESDGGSGYLDLLDENTFEVHMDTSKFCYKNKHMFEDDVLISVYKLKNSVDEKSEQRDSGYGLYFKLRLECYETSEGHKIQFTLNVKSTVVDEKINVIVPNYTQTEICKFHKLVADQNQDQNRCAKLICDYCHLGDCTCPTSCQHWNHNLELALVVSSDFVSTANIQTILVT